jgi:hypothetical protein
MLRWYENRTPRASRFSALRPVFPKSGQSPPFGIKSATLKVKTLAKQEPPAAWSNFFSMLPNFFRVLNDN